ncbi:MAG: hypothetical protein KGI51_04150, partial [Rhodospirillales bacterium]|nr:hypothetical protein [Rhodospirillales bacterium]
EQVPVLLAGAGAAALIGLTRLLLGAHTGAEVGVGAALGLLGAALLGRIAGNPPERLRQRWLLATLVVVLVLFHGMRLPAEPRIWAAAHALGVCRGR